MNGTEIKNCTVGISLHIKNEMTAPIKGAVANNALDLADPRSRSARMNSSRLAP